MNIQLFLTGLIASGMVALVVFVALGLYEWRTGYRHTRLQANSLLVLACLCFVVWALLGLPGDTAGLSFPALGLIVLAGSFVWRRADKRDRLARERDRLVAPD